MKTVDGGEYGTQKDAQKQAAIGKGKMIRTHSDKSKEMTIESDIIQPVKDFIRDSKFLVNRCTKPDKKGFAC